MKARQGKNSKITFIDLFAGCGGLSEGFLQTSQFEALAHIEWEVPMVNTLRKRLIDRWRHGKDEAFRRVVHFDIQLTKDLIFGDWSEDSLQRYGKTNHSSIIEKGLRGLIGNQKVDLIIGGPPCQAYSIAGRAQDPDSMKHDYRNYLFESFVKLVEEFNPKVFVFENVPGLLSAAPGDIPVTQRIYEAFRDIGYKIRHPQFLKKSVYSAVNFGVPQRRNRVILIGVNAEYGLELDAFYSEMDASKKNGRLATVRQTIGHLPSFRPLKIPKKNLNRNISHESLKKISIKHHEPRFHNLRDIEIFKNWLSNNMNKRSSEEKIRFYNSLLGKNSNHAKYRNLEWDEPSPTIVAHLYKDGLMFIHPDEKQLRSITVKEAALLQSFPDDFEFLGSTGYCYKMIGNAVPPEMARSIGIAIAKVVNNYEK